MKCTAAAAALFAGLVAAVPTQLQDRQAYVPCSGLYGTSQCCATDVLGVADLNCANPPALVTSPANFSAVCAAIGQQARCCVLPVLGQDVLCETPAGVSS